VWVKSKNRASEAVRREREEQWRQSPALYGSRPSREEESRRSKLVSDG
jgi:hypothetical protein